MEVASSKTASNATKIDDGFDPRDVARIVEEYGQAPAALVAILQEIQRKHGYLPATALKEVSRVTGRPMVEVYGVATFYRAFSLHPRGKHMVSACVGTACHVRGASTVVGGIERQLGTHAGGTSSDGEFSLETVNCLGACALGPVVVIDGQYISKVGKAKVGPLLDDARNGCLGAGKKGDSLRLQLAVNCPHCHADLMDSRELLDSLPTIRLGMKIGDCNGTYRVSSLYGSPMRITESEAAGGTILNVYCTHCGENLADGWKCTECRAPMVALAVESHALLRVCSRCGCDGHMLDVAC